MPALTHRIGTRLTEHPLPELAPLGVRRSWTPDDGRDIEIVQHTDGRIVVSSRAPLTLMDHLSIWRLRHRCKPH